MILPQKLRNLIVSITIIMVMSTVFMATPATANVLYGETSSYEMNPEVTVTVQNFKDKETGVTFYDYTNKRKLAFCNNYYGSNNEVGPEWNARCESPTPLGLNRPSQDVVVAGFKKPVPPDCNYDWIALSQTIKSTKSQGGVPSYIITFFEPEENGGIDVYMQATLRGKDIKPSPISYSKIPQGNIPNFGCE